MKTGQRAFRTLCFVVATGGLCVWPRASPAETSVKTLHTFGRLPSNPHGKLAVGPDGALYGTTSAGGLTPDGSPGLGTVY
ncbi:MAG TPA: hypothetical protein VH417_09165, partial [Vicinamibacterales bacterium]